MVDDRKIAVRASGRAKTFHYLRSIFIPRRNTRECSFGSRAWENERRSLALSLDLMFPRLPILVLSSPFVPFVIEYNFSFLLDWILDI